MKLDTLSLYQFKNHQEVKFTFLHDITCITGENGIGKTNILDAIYLLANCKSYFNAIDYQLIQHQKSQCSIRGQFSDEIPLDIHLQMEIGKRKRIKRNDKYYDKLIDHIGIIHAVIITPFDIELIHGGSEERRKFIDLAICQTDRVYLNCLSDYNKILEQRNKLLKTFATHKYFDEDLLETYNAKLIQNAQYIYEKRVNVLRQFTDLLNLIYPIWTDNKEEINFVYESALHNTNLSDLLSQNVQKDLATERTNYGIHKDDILFEMNGFALKKFGSQGQNKSFVIALKLAQYFYLANTLSKTPILLLDDLFEKIDDKRAQKLIDYISGDNFGQIIITDTHKKRVQQYFAHSSKSIGFIDL